MPTPSTSPAPYANEAEGQLAFFKAFEAYGITPSQALVANTDGVHNGNLLEFKLNISDIGAVLFQAVKYLAKLRLTGRDVPANILLIDVNARTLYQFASTDYRDAIHKTYASAASRNNEGFRIRREPRVIQDYLKTGARSVVELLKSTALLPVDVSQECVVAWAERYYLEVPHATKDHLLGPNGELKQPRHFVRQLTPYKGGDWSEFAYILDRLNDKMKKRELGAFYTPAAYVAKSHELVRKAIARVPAGNDYVIVDRCAGTGNLERGLGDMECPGCGGPQAGQPHSVLSHTIVNTYEKFEYLELLREFAETVREVIPPTVEAGEDSGFGTLLNGDALSDRFVLGAPREDGTRVPNAIQSYINDASCSIILYENPPYADSSGIENQNEAKRAGGRESFGWKSSWVKKQMSKEWERVGTNNIALRDLSNMFVWSAFRYYLRQDTDSYVVFAPPKYFTTQHVIAKKFIDGFLCNRKHFHASQGSGIAVVLWSNEDDLMGTDSWQLPIFDIATKGDEAGKLVAGSNNGVAPKTVTVRATRTRLSSLYDARPVDKWKPGIACEKNGYEAARFQVKPRRHKQAIGYLSAMGLSFENADLNTQLSRGAAYNVDGGFYLRRDNFLSKLPLFVVGRYPAAGRWWERGVLNRSADNGDNFSQDREFLKQCLIYTALARHNKCLSLTGSDQRYYRNELCFDGDTAASKALAELRTEVGLTEREELLLDLWDTVLTEAKKVTEPERWGEVKRVYDAKLSWGLYQIDFELNTFHPVLDAKGNVRNVADFPQLNSALRTLKKEVAEYHATDITPKLFAFGLLQ